MNRDHPFPKQMTTVNQKALDVLHRLTARDIDKNTSVCVPYDGQYGRGFILCSQHINPLTLKPSTKYMDIDYYVYPKE